MDLRELGWEGVYWMKLAQDKDQWLAGSSSFYPTFLVTYFVKKS
jgi:hypothetical protein